MLRGRRGSDTIYFENIDAPSYSPSENAGIAKSDATATIHVFDNASGEVFTGMTALELLYGAVGLGWVMKLAKLPLLGPAAEILYKLVSKNRVALSGGMDAMLALGKINMEAKGEGSCAEDAECRDTYASEPAEPAEPAAVPPLAASAAAAAGDAPSTAAAPAAAASKPPPELRGSALDRKNILGVYYTARNGESEAFLRAAPVDVDSGTLLAPEMEYPLSSTDVETLLEGTRHLCNSLKWEGIVGVGLPCLLRHAHEVADPSSGRIPMSALERRTARTAANAELQEELEREVLILTGAEANGYGELMYGAGKGEQGVTMMITLGRGCGVALFDHGLLVRNVSTAEHLWSYKLPMWADAQLPPAHEPEDSPAWGRWVERVERYLIKLVQAFSPQLIIVGGEAGESAAKWLHRVRGVSTPMRPATLGTAAGLLGSAVGGRLQLAVRDDLARVRAAIGKAQGVSPQLLKRGALQKVFDSFDTDGSGAISASELEAALRALGVNVPPDELAKIVLEMDSQGRPLAEAQVSFSAFYAWWSDLVASSPVTFLHTEEELDGVLEEEATSGRLVVLEVGFTFCQPCKRFEPIYRGYAQRFPAARFLRINGNENAQMVRVGRDRLGVKTSPSFFFFRYGVEVHRFSGAKEEQFEEALLAFANGSKLMPRPAALSAVS
jgi:polyphosphate glucokinase